jgi:hypothetical protein
MTPCSRTYAGERHFSTCFVATLVFLPFRDIRNLSFTPFPGAVPQVSKSIRQAPPTPTQSSPAAST